MGFSFSGIREELDSKELGKLYRRLQADCRYLATFTDWKAIVAFLHDQKRGYRLKDRVLWRMIQYYRQGGDCERLGTVFLAIFEPAILGLYSFRRSRCPYLGDDDLSLQEDRCGAGSVARPDLHVLDGLPVVRWQALSRRVAE
jgi:hypothetical protein